MKALVLGSKGMLGRSVMERLAASGHAPAGRAREDFDVRDLDALAAALDEETPDALINCAGHTGVDDAEDDPETVMQINADAVGNMARLCKERGVKLVHISTDYVFDGAKGAPYKENDPPRPLNVYGKSKLASEKLIVRSGPPGFLVFRTSWLFGPLGRCFPGSLLERFKNGQREFQIVSDQTGRPTYAPDLAAVMTAALEKDLAGIYHACNQGAVSWYGFAEEVFQRSGLSEEVSIRPVSSAEFPAKARRPSCSVLDTGKLEGALARKMPDYGDALSRYLQKTNARYLSAAL